jgi:arylsulfatase A
MNRNVYLLAMSGILFLPSCRQKEVSVEKPNIVFILADDLGYGDVSCLNKESKINTMNIDKLASPGMIFIDAHSGSAVSSPTRYGILTGRYSWRSTLKAGVLDGYSPALITPGRRTIADILRDRGYNTAAIGKWHLGWEWNNVDKGVDSVDFSKPVINGPTTLGFDYFFGIHASLDMPPYVYVENDMPTSIPDRITSGNNISYGNPGYDGSYWREGPTGADFRHEECLPEIVRHSVTYIEKNAPSDKPYFLYLALPAPHTPILPSEEFRGKSGLNPYADFVLMVDYEVGEVMKAVNNSGEADNTLVVFVSDNGCSPWADFATLKEKGHYPSYIFRGYKADLYDGGHRIPCIIHWPSKMRNSSTQDQTICLNDFFATFASLTGYKLKDNEGEDSYNILPLILNPEYKKAIREATVHHSINGNFSLRKDNWKLLFSAGSGGWSYPRPGKEEEGLPKIQLYDLQTDPGETTNLQNEYPLIVRDLSGILKKYIIDGRSTPGATQKNDGKFPWKEVETIIKGN